MTASPVRVALLGEGCEADRWAAALAPLAIVCRQPEALSETVDAVVLAPGAPDSFARAKEALGTGIPVLYAAPYQLGPGQAALLDALSRAESRFLRVFEPFQYHTGFTFLGRLLRGREPFWQPLYLRTLCVAEAGAPGRLDELALLELARCAALLDGTPLHVTAAGARRDQTGEVCAIFVSVHYSDGPLVQCTVSLAEATTARQLVAVTPHRTVIMDDLDRVTPLRILARGEREGGSTELTLRERGTCREQRGPVADPVAEEARRFVRAVAEGDTSFSNSERWLLAATLWAAARQSMSVCGPVQVPPLARSSAETAPPPLRLIEGGGASVRTAGRRPSLTVVAS